MEINQGANYHTSRKGERSGPVSGAQVLAMARDGELLPTDHLWTEGMEGWVPAGTVAELDEIFDPPTLTETMTTEPEFARNPIAFPIADEPAEPRTTSTPVTALPGADSAALSAALISTRPKASYPLWLFTYLLFLAGCTAVSAITGSSLFGMVSIPTKKLQELATALSEGNPDVVDEFISLSGLDSLIEQPYMLFGAIALLIIGLIANQIFTLRYLHRAWDYLQDLPNPTTTPGKAVALLFIPIFNLYWVFVAYFGWAKDYNMRCDITDPMSTHRVKEPLFVLHCILYLIGFPFLYFLVMLQMCKAINHLAVAPDLELDPNAGYNL